MLYLIMLLVGLIGLSACDNNGKNNDQQVEPPEFIQVDSVKKKQIDQRIDSINQKIVIAQNREKFSFPLLAPEDSIEYWTVDGETKRISMFMTPDSQIVWPTYFMDDGKLLLIRFRYGVDSQYQPWAMEKMMYLENNQVVHCEERRTRLSPGETPGYLRTLPFQLCTESADSIVSVYITMLDKLNNAIAEHEGSRLK
jgi:hypothetical protein